MPHEAPSEPWLSFLNDLDAALDEHTELHCMGGFAIVQAYGLDRATADIDVLSVVPHSSGGRLLELAGKESLLRNRHGNYLDVVTVATAPEDCLARFTPLPQSEIEESQRAGKVICGCSRSSHTFRRTSKGRSSN